MNEWVRTLPVMSIFAALGVAPHSRRDFIATTDFTVADLLMAHVLHSGIKDKSLIAPYPGLVSYRDRCLARPAWQRTLNDYFARVEAG